MSLAVANKISVMVGTEEGTKALQDLWNNLNKDGDDKVTGKEWGSKVYQNKKVMSAHFGGATLSEIGRAFNRLDQNNDDNLSWEEFTSGAKSFGAAGKLAAAMKTEAGSADLKALWDTLDSDGDKKVSGKEWGGQLFKNQDLMRKYFGGASLRDIGLAFNRIDSNGDDSLTWTEFQEEAATYGTVLDMSKAMGKPEGVAELKGLFESLDGDSDGKVSGKEWGSAVFKKQDIMKKYFGGSSLSQIGKAFNRIDADKNDSLTWDEFVTASS